MKEDGEVNTPSVAFVTTVKAEFTLSPVIAYALKQTSLKLISSNAECGTMNEERMQKGGK